MLTIGTHMSIAGGIAKTAKDNIGSYIAIGIAGIFFFHMIENIGMTMGLLPITGVPLPFLSYGGSYTLTTPGTYVINSIWADGIEYELKQPLTITYDGLSIGAINWDLSADKNEVYVMSSNNSYPVEIRANLTASQAFMQNKVEAMFRNEYNEYMIVNLSQAGSQWVGSGKFVTSPFEYKGIFHSSSIVLRVDSKAEITTSLGKSDLILFFIHSKLH